MSKSPVGPGRSEYVRPMLPIEGSELYRLQWQGDKVIRMAQVFNLGSSKQFTRMIDMKDPKNKSLIKTIRDMASTGQGDSQDRLKNPLISKYQKASGGSVKTLQQLEERPDKEYPITRPKMTSLEPAKKKESGPAVVSTLRKQMNKDLGLPNPNKKSKGKSPLQIPPFVAKSKPTATKSKSPVATKPKSPIVAKSKSPVATKSKSPSAKKMLKAPVLPKALPSKVVNKSKTPPSKSKPSPSKAAKKTVDIDIFEEQKKQEQKKKAPPPKPKTPPKITSTTMEKKKITLTPELYNELKSLKRMNGLVVYSTLYKAKIVEQAKDLKRKQGEKKPTPTKLVKESFEQVSNKNDFNRVAKVVKAMSLIKEAKVLGLDHIKQYLDENDTAELLKRVTSLVNLIKMSTRVRFDGQDLFDSLTNTKLPDTYKSSFKTFRDKMEPLAKTLNTRIKSMERAFQKAYASQ